MGAPKAPKQAQQPLLCHFERLFPAFHDLDWTRPILIAVSGGGDSMALLAACTAYRNELAPNARLHAATIDHGLRDGAGDEAKMVAAWCHQNKVPHLIRTLDLDQAPGNLSARARAARLHALLQLCDQTNSRQLLMGHTLDDRLETLLMRTKRGGFRGSASISKRSRCQLGPNPLNEAASALDQAVMIIRPLLTIARKDLRHLLRMQGIPWCDDPTNEDIRFERVRQRHILMAWPHDSPINRDQLHRYCQIMEQLRAVMGQCIARWITQHVTLDQEMGKVMFSANAVQNVPDKIMVEIIRELVRFCGGDPYMVDMRQAVTALNWLRVAKPGQMSIGRCVLALRGKFIQLHRANRNLPIMPLAAGKAVLWDGRYWVATRYQEQHRTSDHIVRPSQGKPIRPALYDRDGVPSPEQTRSHAAITFWPRCLMGPVSASDQPIQQALAGLIGSRRSCNPY